MLYIPFDNKIIGMKKVFLWGLGCPILKILSGQTDAVVIYIKEMSKLHFNFFFIFQVSFYWVYYNCHFVNIVSKITAY